MAMNAMDSVHKWVDEKIPANCTAGLIEEGLQIKLAGFEEYSLH